MTAQHLVEKYSKKRLPDFVAERIFSPLNMTSSSYSPSSATSTGRLSEFYHLGRRIPTFFTEDDVSVMGGAGGILITAEDMMQWGKMLLDITPAESVGIPRQILQDCMSPQVLLQRGASLTYGFGWIQLNVLGTEVGPNVMPFDRWRLRGNKQVVFHDGGIPGAATAMVLLPQHNMSIVQLANDAAATAANNAILATILAEVLAHANHDIL
jgi:CubicO group peptidase (beta-lactamase class C family)